MVDWLLGCPVCLLAHLFCLVLRISLRPRASWFVGNHTIPWRTDTHQIHQVLPRNTFVSEDKRAPKSTSVIYQRAHTRYLVNFVIFPGGGWSPNFAHWHLTAISQIIPGYKVTHCCTLLRALTPAGKAQAHKPMFVHYATPLDTLSRAAVQLWGQTCGTITGVHS